MKGYISTIQDAVKKSTQLKNGEFSSQAIIEGENEKQIVATNGQFTVQNDSIDWRTEQTLGESDDVAKTITEDVQKDKIHYQRSGKINHNHEFIGNDNETLVEEPEWQVISENSIDYPSVLQPLMHLKINQADKTTVDVQKENGQTIYTFTYNDAYLLAQKESNINDLKKQLEKAQKENAESHVLTMLEELLAYNEKLSYSSIQLILTIDAGGVLIGKELKSTFQQMDDEAAQPRHMIDKLEITAYNLADMEIDF